eukprot:TRINITY_DN830_c0_g1_i2.p1 TRINITY_DN830_c0_g1~~TRINITY_DN830_c0_g1_i2.p1  ORF type:complete len:126 (-),score=33.46 TRINITY_DN830_c0_g1_i2:189-566(-)
MLCPFPPHRGSPPLPCAYPIPLTAAKKKELRRGVKEVVKALRKGGQGLCILAGDISPIDVISHIPVLCEENNVPYIYVPSKEELGGASATKRPTSVVLLNPKDGSDNADTFKELTTQVTALAPIF